MARKMVPLTTEGQMETSNANEMFEIGEGNGRSRSCGRLLHSLSAVALHALDVLLLVILLPFMLWQWVSASDRTKIVLKAILEVTLELLMWVVFAGVSILMTATFVVEDIYFRKNDTERLKQLLSAQSGPTSENPDDDKNAHVSETRSVKTERDKPRNLGN